MDRFVTDKCHIGTTKRKGRYWVSGTFTLDDVPVLIEVLSGMKVTIEVHHHGSPQET